MPTKTKEQPAKSSAKKSSVPLEAPLKTVSSNGSSPSSQETLRRLYASLLRCRLLQEQAAKMSAGNYEIALGHEATIVGPTAELTIEDTIAATPANLAALVARGLSPENLLAGEPAGAARHSVTHASLPVDPFQVGTGIALAHKLAGRRNVVVAFCAQESPALEQLHDALKFAGVHKLPVLFVIKNGVADQKSSEEHAPHLEDFSFMARDYGYPGIIVDGQDVVAVFRAAQESIHRARQGSGPTLIDCRTDSKRDPLEYMEHYMRKRKLWDDGWREQTVVEIMGEIEKAEILATR